MAEALSELVYPGGHSDRDYTNLSKQSVENYAEKEAIFKAYRVWENARNANVFTNAIKEKLKDLDYKFHLEQKNEKSFILYPVYENRFPNQAYNSSPSVFKLNNEYVAQPLDFAIHINAPKDLQADGISIKLPNGTILTVDKKLSNGEFVIYKKGVLYIADKNRKKIEEIQAPQLLRLPQGHSVMSVGALHESNYKIKFELVVTAIGKGEKI